MEDNNNVYAPFVMKTYMMVNDPITDCLISWGRANNSFIVVNPLDFSQKILPAYFKHNNFSSFVRQLNTYGFRKVDPDRWEFANEWFLRGEKQLLKNIVRKKHSSKSNHSVQNKQEEEEEEEEMLMEIERLKQEQKVLDRELEGMNKRLEVTERRPEQMMAFLYKVVADPEILPRMILEKERNKRLRMRRRPPLIISSSSVKSDDEDEATTPGVVSSISSPEPIFDFDIFCRRFSPSSSAQLFREPYNIAGFSTGQASTSSAAGFGGFAAVVPPMNGMLGYDNSGGDVRYFGGTAADEVEAISPPYPFSLLGGGF